VKGLNKTYTGIDNDVYLGGLSTYSLVILTITMIKQM